jgi:hypothetical protein
MTAVTDIQQALNVIRRIESEATVDTKVAALAMVTATAAEMARDLRGEDQQSKKRATAQRPSSIKPMPVSKPAAPAQSSNTAAPTTAMRKARPFTEPELPSSTIETL